MGKSVDDFLIVLAFPPIVFVGLLVSKCLEGDFVFGLIKKTAGVVFEEK